MSNNEAKRPSSLVDRPWSIVYIGSIGGMEEQIVANESNLAFRAIPAAALRGRGPAALLRGLLTLAAGVRAARSLIRELRPAAILGTGGYVCAPLFLAARLARVPTMIYLPDVVPGLAVRLLSRIATVTAVNVADALPRLGLAVPGQGDRHGRLAMRPHGGQGEGDPAPRSSRPTPRAIVTGYPVRAELFSQDKGACRRVFAFNDERPVVLVYGGSRGARSVNQAVRALLPALLEECQIIHICGREGDQQWLREAAAQLPAELQARYRLHPYLETTSSASGGRGARCAPTATAPTMLAAFGAADLAICRSGASTLAELPAAGLPAVLVPYPYVHQDENADYLVARSAAVKVADATMLGDDTRPQDGALYPAVIRLIRDKHERERMAERSRALARPDAAQHLAAALLSLATRSGG